MLSARSHFQADSYYLLLLGAHKKNESFLNLRLWFEIHQRCQEEDSALLLIPWGEPYPCTGELAESMLRLHVTCLCAKLPSVVTKVNIHSFLLTLIGNVCMGYVESDGGSDQTFFKAKGQAAGSSDFLPVQAGFTRVHLGTTELSISLPALLLLSFGSEVSIS